MIVDICFAIRKMRCFTAIAREILIVRNLVVVRAGRELEMKTKLRIDVFVDVQSEAIAAADILQRSGDGRCPCAPERRREAENLR